ncbi:cyclin-dependent kinase inhibitor 1Ca [Scophthalmus maximus]|nr:cyclin-dependent kinase inhibitor 1Ca [Scophthalmus maximus]
MTSIRRKESACRSLFGPVDHEQLRRDLALRLSEVAEQDSRRWNFDFQAGAPLPGRFQWEETPAAAFYQEEPALPRDAVCPPVAPGRGDADGGADGGDEAEGASAGTDQENCPRISNTRCPAEVTPLRGKRSLSKPAAKRRSANARITDFFAKRRRTTDTKSPHHLHLHHTSSSEAALCKTIR